MENEVKCAPSRGEHIAERPTSHCWPGTLDVRLKGNELVKFVRVYKMIVYISVITLQHT